MAMMHDPILELKMIKEAEKKLERSLVRLSGEGALVTASNKYKNSITKVKAKETKTQNQINSLGSKISSSIKGKWSKSVQDASKKESKKITAI